MFFLDLIDNLPRLRQSDDSMKVIIFTLRELGVENVPSLSALRTFQAKQTQHAGVCPTHHISALQNHFYVNHPAKLFGLDFANPLVRQQMHFYPEVSNPVTESWQADKWLHEVEPNELSPMWANFSDTPKHHFFTGELAQLSNGCLVVPRKWIIVSGVPHFEMYDITYSSEVSIVYYSQLILIEPILSHL